MLILKDGISCYVYLRSCRKINHASVSFIIDEYFTTFMLVLQWFSDQGPNFCTDVMETLSNTQGVGQRFSAAYVSWFNVTVEAVCEETLCFLQTMSTDMRVPEVEWPTVVPAKQSVINKSPACRLSGKGPITPRTETERGEPLSATLKTAKHCGVSNLIKSEMIQRLTIERHL